LEIERNLESQRQIMLELYKAYTEGRMTDLDTLNS